ncbi:penicillin-binding protein [Microlunatus elymi]|uniref:Penicillin-binding protein n=1 Tax=Microlunatus elymi TaxID=2596828 RepID=A0A516PUH3_9ACTN|nr:transglycosylase domain-containing protein [Microlunatus elymi]QDP94827.1 penicillin-binding protein [Microlunatus elymi]
MAESNRRTRSGTSAKTGASTAKKATANKATGRKQKKKRGPGRIIGRIALTMLILVVVGGLASAAFVGVSYQRLTVPDPNAEFTTNTTNIYYHNGKTKLGDIAIQNRQSIRYDQMPDSIKNAVVAAENKTFWTDPGYSIQGMIRAGANIVRGGSLQSGSTITQQYIKIMYLSQEQTASRKYKEILLARKLSQQMSKQDILTGYLNTIYFGRGAYGIQAASKAYFDEDASELTVPQSAVLAAVLNSPSYFDPEENGGDPDPLLGRYRYVLTSMQESGFLTAAQEAKYAKKLPKFPKIKVSEKYGGSQGFLMKAVESELSTLPVDQAQVRGGGYKIITTFDKSAQDAAVQAAQDNTAQAAQLAGRKKSNLHAAIASVDTDTGGVVAMYGGPDYIKNSRNWATTPRAAASTFKPFALATGLENGFSLYSIMNGNTFTPPGDGVPIRNEFSTQYGPVTLLKATADSINTAFVDLDTKLPGDGPQKVIDTAQKLGAVKQKGAQDWVANNRVAIGSAQVSPLNMANAYATFANNGEYLQNHVISEILDNHGKVIYQADPKPKRAISSDVAADVTYALQGVVKDGTGTAAQSLGRPVAGKTGTQGVGDKITSAWFTGYTKQIATSVMYVAGDGGTMDLDNFKRPWDATFFGSSYPAQTWVDYMKVATQDQKVREFTDPAYVNRDKFPPPAKKTPKQKSDQQKKQNDKPTGQASASDQPSDKPSDQPTDQQSERPTNTASTQPSNKPTQQTTDKASAPATSKAPNPGTSATSKPPKSGGTSGAKDNTDTKSGSDSKKSDTAGNTTKTDTKSGA